MAKYQQSSPSSYWEMDLTQKLILKVQAHLTCMRCAHRCAKDVHADARSIAKALLYFVGALMNNCAKLFWKPCINVEVMAQKNLDTHTPNKNCNNYVLRWCFLFFFTHLRQRLKISYCHQPVSVVSHVLVMCHKQFALNIFSETWRPRALIFVMKHCLVDLFQVCSVGDPRVQNGPAAGGLGFENEMCLKIFSRTAGLRCLKILKSSSSEHLPQMHEIWHGKSCLMLNCPMQTQTEFLQHTQFEQWHPYTQVSDLGPFLPSCLQML